MCTYNGEQYLLPQLKSILHQTQTPSELILCDDGSTDTTLDIAQTFAADAPFPVRIVQNATRLGSTKNFEQAIKLCTGDFIALCDQDDVWYPEKLATLLSLLTSDPAIGGVFSDGDLTGPQGQHLDRSLWQSFRFDPLAQSKLSKGLVEQVFFRLSVVTGTTMMFRASLRDKLLPIPTSWVHDGWLAWMLSLHSRLAPCRAKLMAYRVHPSQQIGAPTSDTTFLKSMFREGTSRYLDRMRRKHIGDYENSWRRFDELNQYLANNPAPANAAVFRDSLAKARFSRDVAGALGMPRSLRFRILLRHIASYFRFTARPVRILIRDMVL